MQRYKRHVWNVLCSKISWTVKRIRQIAVDVLKNKKKIYWRPSFQLGIKWDIIVIWSSLRTSRKRLGLVQQLLIPHLLAPRMITTLKSHNQCNQNSFSSATRLQGWNYDRTNLGNWKEDNYLFEDFEDFLDPKIQPTWHI